MHINSLIISLTNGLQLETNLAVRTELMKMGATINKIVAAQSNEEIKGRFMCPLDLWRLIVIL